MNNAATAAQTKETLMGDRANVFLVMDRAGDQAAGIYLYTHYYGSEWEDRAEQAIAAGRDRWGDDQYFNRFFTTEMFKDLTGTAGGGISFELGDNSHDIVVVDPTTQTIATAADPKNVKTWRRKRPFETLVD